MNSEATDALMATLGEYDVLWDGTLLPEIIDADFYDCPNDSDWGPDMPTGMYLSQDFDLMQIIDRYEALLTLIEVVKCCVGTCLEAPLFSEEVDGMMYDCPCDGLIFETSPDDWPTLQSLK